MGDYMIGTWLYTLISIIPLAIWSIYILTKEGWLSRRGPKEKIMRVVFYAGVAYQILLPFFWCYFVSPNGLVIAG